VKLDIIKLKLKKAYPDGNWNILDEWSPKLPTLPPKQPKEKSRVDMIKYKDYKIV
jgi:hypothetical protein